MKDNEMASFKDEDFAPALSPEPAGRTTILAPTSAQANTSPSLLHGGGLRRLNVSLLVTNAVLFAAYNALFVITLPQQVAEIDPVGKVSSLALVMSVSSFATMFAQPLAGALSDRTRSRLGRRAPWLLFGGVLGGIAIIALQFSTTIAALTVVWALCQAILNVFQGPQSALVADRVSYERRASSSAFIGIGQAVGGFAVLAAGLLVHQLGVAYWLFGSAMIIATVIFVLINRDPSSVDLARQRFSFLEYLKSFWVNPRRHPDFGWAFAGRFLMWMGYQGVSTYQYYILTDFLHLNDTDAGAVAGYLFIVLTVFQVLGTAFWGWLSDRMGGRRKVFVFTASILIALGCIVPVISPTLPGMYIFSILAGLGIGAYTAVDTALVIDVLPAREGGAAKDLGIINIAANVPQALTPIVAALLLGVSGNNYMSIFLFGAVAVTAASVTVFRIRSIR